MRIGVLTGGGDCPGLNPAIRAIVRVALDTGWQVTGVLNGWAGVMDMKTREMDLKSVSGILPLGGTILGTSRTNPARSKDGIVRALANINAMGLDALIAIGGDDTLSVAYRLFQQGAKTVGVPKTMDNDVNGTDYCIGFDSAATTVVDALDKLHTTASSHHRVMVVEVMGRDAGWIATVSGLAGGADYILVPEVPADLDEVCDHLRNRYASGKEFSIVVVAEGVHLTGFTRDAAQLDDFGHVRLDKRGVGESLGDEIERRTGFETRVTVLGHLQRGGSPSVFDRVLATRLGIAAVDLVKQERWGMMPALRGNRIVPCSLEEAISVNRQVDLDLYRLARIFY